MLALEIESLVVLNGKKLSLLQKSSTRSLEQE